jgi:hypothetical protein
VSATPEHPSRSKSNEYHFDIHGKPIDASWWATLQAMGAQYSLVCRSVVRGWLVTTEWTGKEWYLPKQGLPRIFRTNVHDPKGQNQYSAHWGSREEAVEGHASVEDMILRALRLAVEGPGDWDQGEEELSDEEPRHIDGYYDIEGRLLSYEQFRALRALGGWYSDVAPRERLYGWTVETMWTGWDRHEEDHPDERPMVVTTEIDCDYKHFARGGWSDANSARVGHVQIRGLIGQFALGQLSREEMLVCCNALWTPRPRK